jgi:hypothetical protein
MISNYISLPIFLISFAIGLFCIYVVGPELKTVYIYPSPENYANIQYQDKASQCFEFKPVETKCPINPYSVKSIPVQL